VISSLEFDLVKPMFYARPGVRILSVPIAKFHPNFDKFETFEMQVFDDITPLQFHRNGAFWYLHFMTLVCPLLFPAETPNCHNIHRFRLAIDGRHLGSPRKGEPY
jgi:hypothetical protein